MAHLVSSTYPDIIRPILIENTARQFGLPQTSVRRIAYSIEFKILLRQSLFLGLSDGARTDWLRRSTPEINNEQISMTYDLSKDKVKDMLDHLQKDLAQLLGRVPTGPESKFQMMFLLDDFSGSGLSYLRYEPNSGYAGKLHRVFQSVYFQGPYAELIERGNLQVCVVIYVATDRAMSHLKHLTAQSFADRHLPGRCNVFAVQVLPETISLRKDKDTDFLRLLERYFDDSIVTEHFHHGLHNEPYLGYDQCALPLILSHNTPNNSIPLLWFPENLKVRGLFPRVSRHR
jgi:hypothetical protein